MLALDLEKPLLDAGGHYATRAVLYDEVVDPAIAEERAIPLDRLLPGVPGALDVGHPQACESPSSSRAPTGGHGSLPAARRRPARPIRGAAPAGDVPGRLPVPLSTRGRGRPHRP